MGLLQTERSQAKWSPVRRSGNGTIMENPAGGMVPARAAKRRYLSLVLPDWATDCLKRHDPGSPVREGDRRKTGPAGLKRPLVVYEKRDNAMRLVATDAAARAAGLNVGQSLSDARALCPGVVAREADHGFFATMFAQLADWHANVSPIVAVIKTEQPYGDLMLDITGVAHLFGGERALLDAVTTTAQHPPLLID